MNKKQVILLIAHNFHIEINKMENRKVMDFGHWLYYDFTYGREYNISSFDAITKYYKNE